ncbi:OB-fold nucleic acid binding domain-containing protein [Halovivax sp.]|uniref:DHH family phosphoesterase n=1 Tax=Halovivax sp. TaxID=1935978 RepID=UPI0025BEB258|nr:OB-fold nucleic acid binding domain-containing protein [Halovivax sp.]
MGTCIICGTPVDGEICELHEEDVAFVFRGDAASELTPGRYYRGTVDGYADFGVFVDIGPRVTGLLHRSELDQRLESLDWEPGDSVFVQVLDVRDNGNVDLGWSIRQSTDEFRGAIVDGPDGETRLGEEEAAEASANERDSGSDAPTKAAAAESGASAEPAGNESAGTVATAGGGSVAVSSSAGSDDAADASLSRTTVDALDDQVGNVVRLEGEITGVRQTSGPTVFELRDETGAVECAAFEEAGVRAYPDVDVEDVVALEGEVENHHGDLQIETESLAVLTGEEGEEVRDRLENAIEREARPGAVELLAAHDAVATVEEAVVDAATAIRRAVMEARPVVVRHNATADGYVAGAAIERAVLPLLREKHTRDDAVYHYFERRPLDGRIYDMDAATGDATAMLDARERHGEQLPLVVVVDAGSTVESTDAYGLLERYGADRLVIDASRADEAVADAVSVSVAPSLAGADVADCTSTALAANVAAHVNDDVREDLRHLPALSYWESPPEAYVELADGTDFDADDLAERREAVALEAYYQSYKDKRELVEDLLFDEGGDLAAHVSEQFRDKLGTELETARENTAVRGVDGVTITTLDTAQFTHRFDFPSTELLLSALHRRERDRTEPPFVTLGVDDDELHVRATEPVDVRELGGAIADAVPDGGVRVVGGADGRVEFLQGQREAVREAALEALGELLG